MSGRAKEGRDPLRLWNGYAGWIHVPALGLGPVYDRRSTFLCGGSLLVIQKGIGIRDGKVGVEKQRKHKFVSSGKEKRQQRDKQQMADMI